MITPEELAEALGRPSPTAEQSAVIAAPLDPGLVIAGAGSGKTETIAARVVYLVVNGLVEPGRVLGLTFTRKAAAELGVRIRSRLAAAAGRDLGGPGMAAAVDGADPVIGTYHAFAGQLINEFGPLAGIEPASRVLTATETWRLARDIVGRWDRDLQTEHGPERVTEDILAISSALADHLLDPDALDDELAAIGAALTAAPPSRLQKGPVHSGLTDVIASLAERRSVLPLVREFTAAKRAMRAVDFADQMQLAARLVAASPRVAETLRDRHGIVLLDEYQDTGHAQRVILTGLFGGAGGAGHPVTAVGDPVQSIYGWRGASASNLPRFTTDFPRGDGSPAGISPLLISFRNDEHILVIANTVSAEVRRAPVAVGELRAGPAAGVGRVTSALLPTVSEENSWLAEALAALQADGAERTMAVLVRRRAAMGPIAAALREAGLSVEIVGVGGLVDEPEVADTIAMLRMVLDHQSGPAAVRLLTGARWRLGIADLAALARRARSLRVTAETGPRRDDDGALAVMRRALAEAVGGEDVDETGLTDAIADPGRPADYSAAGWERIGALAGELRYLRSRLTAPLPDLVADVQRVMRLDVEVALAPDGRVHLDAFDEVVAQLAAAGAGPVEMLDYLATAGEREDGLPPGATEAPPGRVQILTVHSAKGLEWDVVALPHLVDGVFPADKASSWLGDPTQLPPALRGDQEDLPELDLPADADQARLAALIKDHRSGWAERQAVEERRLFYVAVTRARHQLLLSAHYWSAARKTPSGPGRFFAELAGAAGIGSFVGAETGSPQAGSPQAGSPQAGSRHGLLGDIDRWTDPPEEGETNPELDRPVTASWPVDPLGDRRAAVEQGAALVRAALVRAVPAGPVASGAGLPASDPATDPVSGSTAAPDPETVPDPDAAPVSDPDGWEQDIDLLLAERASARAASAAVPLPAALSVSALVELAADPRQLARRLRRPLPQRPAPQARRGTAFHAWLERHFAGDPLLDLDELPGAHDGHAASDGDLPELIDAFLSSQWAVRTPIAIETPFITSIAGLTVRGRIDAVFAEPDGGAVVVDWKTGAVPGPERARAVAIQLTAYRLAWSRLTNMPLERVRAAFYYVAAGRTITPEYLLDAAGLEELIATATDAS